MPDPITATIRRQVIDHPQREALLAAVTTLPDHALRCVLRCMGAHVTGEIRNHPAVAPLLKDDQ